jgi:hypothetical protein
MKNYQNVFLSLLFIFGSTLSSYAEETSVTETTETEETTGSESLTSTESFASMEGGGFDMTQTMEQANTLGAYFGYSNVGGENFIGFNLQPEIQIGKLGVGLDIPIQFNITDFKFRTDQYTDGVAWLRMIRFVSWGIKKQDKLYVKVGDLTGSYLGYGMLINNYSNSISVDKRKIGVDLDYCYKNFIGIEILYSDVDVQSLNLLGIRPYIKPLAFTGIPIIKTFDIGFQYVTDRDNTGSLLSGDEGSNHNTYLGSSGVSGKAIDMGVMLLNMPMVRLVAFGSAAMLDKNKSSVFKQALVDSVAHGASDEFKDAADNYDNGYGFSVGLDLKVKFLGNLFRLDTRVERLSYTDYFTPHFFDVTYEINKDARIMSNVTSKRQKGTYGELGLTVLDKILVSGGMLMPDNIGEGNPALLRLTLDGSKISKAILLEGEYIKGGLTKLEDAFKLDDRSLLSVRAAYKVVKMFYVGVKYNWTWAANASGKFVPTSYWEPYVGFKFDLGFLNK